MRTVNQSLVGVQRQTSTTASVMQAAALGLGGALATMAAGAGTMTGLFSLANLAGNFERSLAGVASVTRATAADLESLRRSAIDAGIATQFSPDQAVEGLLSLATAGQTAQQATATLIPVLDLAAGSLGQLAVGEAASAVVGTLNAYGMAAERATTVTDKLLRITQLTNFQARDFEIGLAKAAAAGATFGTSLDDVLITVGMLRNRNIDASSSATAFREATRRLASDQGAQEAVAAAGVRIFEEQSGEMRSVVDIMLDLVDATRSMTDEEKGRIVVQAAGARGLLAFSAMESAAFTTMRDGRQVTLQGRDAIAALRDAMADAGGTAAGFRARLLDTFEGQKTLLEGTLQTMGVVFGEPAARVFKPLIEVLTNGLNTVIRLFDALPKAVQTAMAGTAGAVGLAMFAFGGLAVVGLTITLLLPVLQTLLTVMAGIAAAAIPLIAAAAAVGVAVASMALAIRRNIGGLGDTFDRLYNAGRLAFHGLTQLFASGAISGEVASELQRVENAGVLRLISTLYAAGFRIQRFIQGITEGFGTFMENNRGAFDALVTAVTALGGALGFVSESAQSFAGGPSEEVAGRGRVMGEVLGKVAVAVLDVVTRLTEFATWAVGAGQAMWAAGESIWEKWGPVVRQLIDGFVEVAGVFWSVIQPFMDVFVTMMGFLFTQLMDNLGLTGESADGFADNLGAIIAIAKGVAVVLGVVVNIVSIGFSAFMAFAGAVVWVLTRLKELVSFVTSGPFRLLASALEGLGLAKERGQFVAKGETVAEAKTPAIVSAPSLAGAFPAGAEAMSRFEAEETRQSTMGDLLAAVSSRPREQATINLYSTVAVDGEVLATANQRAVRSMSSAGFEQVSIGEEG
jgi:TP901 family phage tail tape measure protein